MSNSRSIGVRIAIAALIIVFIIVAAWQLFTTPGGGETASPTTTETVASPTEAPKETIAPEVNNPPYAIARASSLFAKVGEVIEFDGTLSKDPDGKIVEYVWDFGDGTTAFGAKVSHAYELPGSYIVVLTVKDDKGAVDTNDETLLYITVEIGDIPQSPDSPPVAVISSDKDIVTPGEEVSFDGSSSWAWVEKKEDDKVSIVKSVEAITEYVWDFGDGTTATGKSVTHTFEKPGSYPVKLTVKAVNGKTASAIKTIRVVEEKKGPAIQLKHPDTIIVARIGEPQGLDPAFAHDTASAEIIDNVYERLVWTTKNFKEIKPWLAERWEIKDNGTTYIFYIRKGVKFHNGEELTAYDVEYSFKRLLVLDLPQGHVRQIKPFLIDEWDPDQIDQAIRAIDKYTVVFKLKKPFAPFLRILASDYAFVIINKKWAIEHGDWDPSLPKSEWSKFRGKINDYIMRNPMGTGPYKMVEWVPGQRIVLERFEDYWQGPAPTKRVVIMFVPELSTRLLMLKNGDVDIADIPVSYKSQVENVPGITIFTGAATNVVEFIQFNFNISKIPEGDTIWPDFFTDVNVRKAFAYAFPYEEFIEKAYQGLAIRARACVPPGWPGYVEAYNYEYDPEKAAEYFKKAWGGRVWEEGFVITAFYNAGNEQRRIALELLAESLQKINPKFKLRVQALDWPVYLEKMENFELPLFAIGDWINYLDPHIAVEQQLASYSLFQSLGGGYSNPKVDELIKQAALETDPQKREELYKQIQLIALREDVPQIYTVYPTVFVVMRDWIQGYFYNPFYGGIWYYALTKG
ncbi:ABC transporter, substrate-binding protein precursor [Aeropyrum pernix K1]|uniref:ABC transporter, substrate-binding protein n=1 Tax=Aeropyrum pernix (strain ATCC 700893 / DSM 11879 / JCM 9820 / NBRC 100138 / K1) TaxID=272557 RepID=Q9YFD7_AERPE|nr:ABC transporter substrate-binding protein [Aeropyrum pernix]BAA79259.2 ABC transporter, substrate-binding protein precursor [Aeropyrum pernix K1]